MTQSHSFLCVSLSSKPVNSLQPKISCFILSFMCWQTNNNPQMSSKVFFSTFAIIQVSKLPITTPWLSGQAMLTRKYEHHIMCAASQASLNEERESWRVSIKLSEFLGWFFRHALIMMMPCLEWNFGRLGNQSACWYEWPLPTIDTTFQPVWLIINITSQPRSKFSWITEIST